MTHQPERQDKNLVGRRRYLRKLILATVTAVIAETGAGAVTRSPVQVALAGLGAFTAILLLRAVAPLWAKATPSGRAQAVLIPLIAIAIAILALTAS